MSIIRRRMSRQPSDDAEVNMTPMLDIVFIMLIFFIVTAVFLDETGLDFTQPPPSEASHKPVNPTILVQIDEKNTITIDQNITELSAVELRVEKALADKPDAAILLVADDKASWDPVVSIKDQMIRAGRPVLIEVKR